MFDPGAPIHTHPAADRKGSLSPSRTQLDSGAPPLGPPPLGPPTSGPPTSGAPASGAPTSGAPISGGGTTALNSANNAEDGETKTGSSTNVASLREFCVKNSTMGTSDEFGHPEEKKAKGLTHFK